MTKLIRVPFAENGDKVEVPLTQQDDGSVSYAQGYPLNYELDPNTDSSAKRVERTKMNQLFFDLTSAVRELQVNGVAPWITAADNGGAAFSYGLGAVVLYNGTVYRSSIAANTSTPGSTEGKWIPLPSFNENRTAVFTAAGSFPVPAGVTDIWVTGCGGGGGGGGGGGAVNNTSFGGGGGGGGAGQFVIKKRLSVTPLSTLAISPGTGGAAGLANTSQAGPGFNGGAGSASTVGSLLSLTGGGFGGGGGFGSNVAVGGSPGDGFPQGGFGNDGSLNTATGSGGSGGNGPFGGAGAAGKAGRVRVSATVNAAGYGCGGGGGGAIYPQGDTQGLAGSNGGAGAPGFLIIEW